MPAIVYDDGGEISSRDDRDRRDRALAGFERALYVTTTDTGVGYDDVVPPRRWRALGAIEGPNGIVLQVCSTAFLVTVVGRSRLTESDAKDRWRRTFRRSRR